MSEQTSAADIRQAAMAPARKDIWQRLSGVVVFLIVLTALACILVFFKPELDRREALRAEVIALSERYEARRGEADAMERKLELLRNDLNYFETVARDRLHLQKEGEKVIRVVRE